MKRSVITITKNDSQLPNNGWWISGPLRVHEKVTEGPLIIIIIASPFESIRNCRGRFRMFSLPYCYLQLVKRKVMWDKCFQMTTCGLGRKDLLPASTDDKRNRTYSPKVQTNNNNNILFLDASRG